MTDLWWFDVSEIDAHAFEAMLSFLPSSMQADVMRYRFQKDRNLKLVGRLLVAQYHMEYGNGFEWDQWKVANGGKPFIHRGFEFNISHAGNIVVVAFSDAAVGVDIEELKEQNFDELQHYFHEKERQYLQESPSKAMAFYHVWTRKEAFLKATGIGIVDGLDKNNCLEDSILVDKKWYLHSLNNLDGYQIAVCSVNTKETINEKKMKGIHLPLKAKDIV